VTPSPEVTTGKEVTPLSAFAKVFDPTFEDLEDPYRHYNPDGEPLEDRLYLPVGFDPGKTQTEVVALHPHPGHDQIVLQRTIPTTGLTAAFQLVEEAQRVAEPFGAVPVFVFEATSIYWRPLRDLFVRLGLPTATVSAVQVKHLRGTQIRKKKNDAIDSLQVAMLFKNGASHASRIPPEPLASLRELCRAHLFFAEFLVAAQNRMTAQQCVRHPESRAPFTRVTQRTPMTLMTQGLIAPARLLALSLEELTQLLRHASHGRHGVEEARQLRQSALTTLAMPPAEAAVSYSLALLGRSSLYVADQILQPLEHRIRELLHQVPFRHHLEEIPFFGPIVIGTILKNFLVQYLEQAGHEVMKLGMGVLTRAAGILNHTVPQALGAQGPSDTVKQMFGSDCGSIEVSQGGRERQECPLES
jgi:hypothetical protein